MSADVRAPDANAQQPYDTILTDITTYVYNHNPLGGRAHLHARTALLDSLGCAAETVATCPEAVNLLGPWGGNGFRTENGFKLPGTSYSLDPVKGAWDMGMLIRYMDHSDGFFGAEWGHPSDNLGAILALSDFLARNPSQRSQNNENAPPLTVRTVWICIIKAYEVEGLLQILNSFNAFGLDHVILVKVASAAVASWLLGLSEVQCHAVLSHAFIDGHPLRTYRQAPNTMPRKGWAGGDAASRAVALALLVQRGQVGMPTALTAKRWGFNDSTFGGKEMKLHRQYGSWVMENIFFKLAMAEGHSISALEASMRIIKQMKEKGLDAEADIERIRIRTHAGAILIISKQGKLHNAADRDHCMQYILAVTFLKGRAVEPVDYQNDSPFASDPRVDSLREKMEMVEEPKFSRDYLDVEKHTAANGVKVFFKNGEEIDEVVVEHPLGHANHPDTVSAVEEKARKNLARAYSPEQVEGVFKAVNETDSMPVNEFLDSLAKEDTGSYPKL